MKNRETERWDAAAWDMLYLVQCGIHSIVPDLERVAKMDLEKVYARSKSQSLEVLACMALESLMESNPEIQIPDENDVFAQWKNEKNKIIAKSLMMDVAREELFSYLEEQGIWHIVLKGVVLRPMYPQYGMRQMADNDILFDASFRQEVHDWFVEHGYKVKRFQKSNHDEYHKNPVYNFEMHVALFWKGEQPELAEYYATIKDRLIQSPDKPFEYYMTNEDCYLYIVAHEYKHDCYAGIGVRSLLDMYVYNMSNAEMDRSYLDEELRKTGLFAFEKKMRDLALKIFDPNPKFDSLSEDEWMELKKLLFSGTYGTLKELQMHQIRQMQPGEKKISIGAKLKYLKFRLFPGKAYMDLWCQDNAPCFVQHRWLMPIAPAWRIIRGGIKKKKQIGEELNVVKKA